MIYLERKGVPTVSVASAGFEKDTVASARAFGMPRAPFAVVPDVITSVPPERSKASIAERIDVVVRGLTDPEALPELEETGPLTERLPGEPLDFNGADQLDALAQFNETFLEYGWGDGLPLLPPTPESVDRMLTGTALSPEYVVGLLPPGMGIATVQKIAVSAAMAGCEPSHLPVLIAACEAVIKMGSRARQWLMSTSPDAPILLLNGPIVDELGLNTGKASLGPGKQSKVNIVLGRAFRLVLMNVGHNYPTEMDMDTIGAPAKFSLCAAEPVKGGPWEGLHEERGFLKNASTVTVAGVRNLIDAADLNNFTPERVLNTVAGGIRGGGGYVGIRWSDPDPYDPEGGGGTLVILCPDHARVCTDAGWSKDMVRDYLWAKTRITAAGLQGSFKENPDWLLPPWRWIMDLSPEEAARTSFPAFNRPERIEIVSFGGPAGKSMTMMTNGPSQTVEVQNRT
ncbi:MAG: hypothetical protein HOC77_03720 [Chloroflexi bacterium]|jgi:hypothetical protein|nr:hypothetical protein [Chloroflexota bacterium]MBT4074533.1 hypothetical protein [Chloroflexota bacterium]MBT4514187.1 hypothetical protein [Chloroflexota bacterium]MBT5319006.1 hypothetical protein [Chloroflexota bacterium]MBT6681593.1 hypothetical protein [Chloroflexota bacterium]